MVVNIGFLTDNITEKRLEEQGWEC